jgi:glycosyltransferase involved in cell wall biosynthesis
VNGQKPLGSAVIPAHNEARVIRRCLDALFVGFAPGELEVVVVCNGCVDDTAAVARSSGHDVRVIELGRASKPEALRTGDAAVAATPRLYVDADVVLPGPTARRVLERLRAGAVAARPPVRYDASRASAPVRAYYRARSRVPAVLGSLWGAGVYGLSAEGRARFGPFPDVVADDLWVDRLFEPGEVEIVDSAPVVVEVPRRTRDLIAVLRRTYRGKAEKGPDRGEGPAQTVTATLRDLGRHAAVGPAAARDAMVYAAFAVWGRLELTLVQATGDPLRRIRWERDESSRAG